MAQPSPEPPSPSSDAAPAAASANEGPARSNGSRAWARWLVYALGAVTALLVLGLVVLFKNLDSAWLKQQVQKLALDRAGLAIDYRRLSLEGWSELALDDLVVQTPGDLHAAAAEFVRLRSLRARWFASELLSSAPRIEAIELAGLTLTVVLDERGRTTFDALATKSKAPPEPTTPLSQWPHQILHASGLVQRIAVRDATAVLVRTDHARVIERDTLRGLALALDTAPPGKAPHVTLSLGTSAAPLPLELEHQAAVGAGAASAKLSLQLVLDAALARARLELDVTQQTLAPTLALTRLAALSASARFEPRRERTLVTLDALEIADGAASASAELTVPDQAPPLVQRAAGDVDLVHILQLVPASLVPLQLERGQLHYRIEGLSLIEPTSSAKVALDAALTGVHLALAPGELQLTDAKLQVQAQPQAGALAIRGSGALTGLRVQQPGLDARAEDVTLNVDGSRTDSGTTHGKLELAFEELALSPLAARHARVTLGAHDLQVDPAQPSAARGDLAVEAKVARIELAGAPRVSLTDLVLAVKLPLRGGAPFALDAKLEAGRVQATQGKDALLDAPLAGKLSATAVHPDLQQPVRSTGDAHLELALAALRADTELHKRDDALDFELRLTAEQLGVLRPLLSADLASRVPWSQVALSLESKGRLEGLLRREPTVREQTKIALRNPRFDDVSAREFALELESHGSRVHHRANVALRASAIQVGAHALGEETAHAKLELDRNAPSAHLVVRSERLVDSELDADITFERAGRMLEYELKGHVGKLERVTPLIEELLAGTGVDWAPLALRMQSQGRIAGLVETVDAEGMPRFSPDPLRTVAGRARFELDGSEVHWSAGSQAARLPTVKLLAKFEGEGPRRQLDNELTIAELELGIGAHRVRVNDLHDHTVVTLPNGVNGIVEHKQQLTVGALRQRIVPSYPIGQLTLSVDARRNPDGSIKLNELRFENVAGGSRLTAQGNADLTPDTRRMTLHAQVAQDLSRVSSRREDFIGQGQLNLDLALASPDFHLFHALSRVQLERATLELPTEKIKLSAIDGEIPVLTDFTFGDQGVELLRGAQINPYAAQRFADQHPLLSHRSFVSIERISTPVLSIAPFAANLKVERNIVSLSQMELGVRKGVVTGNGIFEYAGLDSSLQTNVRASGVQSSHGEPFDGNAALVMDIRDRSIEGRADILRIGKRHLLDLLDVQDPQRGDPAFNQIRTALKFGYPDRVRIAFKHGFASAGVQMAGLARLVRINDVRGIPIGPLIERVLDSLQPPEEP